MGIGAAGFAYSDDDGVSIWEYWDWSSVWYDVELTVVNDAGQAKRVDAGGRPDGALFATYEEALSVAARLTTSAIRYAHDFGGGGLVLAEGGRVHWPHIQQLRQEDVDHFNERADVR